MSYNLNINSIIVLLDFYEDSLMFFKPLCNKFFENGFNVSVIFANPPYNKNKVLSGSILSDDVFSDSKLNVFYEDSFSVECFDKNSVVINLLKSNVPLALTFYYKLREYFSFPMFRIFRGLGPGIFYRGTSKATLMANYAFVYGNTTVDSNLEVKDRLFCAGSLKVQYIRNAFKGQESICTGDNKNKRCIMFALDNVYEQFEVLESILSDPDWNNFRLLANNMDINVCARHHIGSSPELINELDGLFGDKFDYVSSVSIYDDFRMSDLWVCFFGSSSAIEALAANVRVALLPYYSNNFVNFFDGESVSIIYNCEILKNIIDDFNGYDCSSLYMSKYLIENVISLDFDSSSFIVNKIINICCCDV
jgi:hypothetical protein